MVKAIAHRVSDGRRSEPGHDSSSPHRSMDVHMPLDGAPLLSGRSIQLTRSKVKNAAIRSYEPVNGAQPLAFSIMGD
jgi:hypothetical protein